MAIQFGPMQYEKIGTVKQLVFMKISWKTLDLGTNRSQEAGSELVRNGL